MKAIDEVGRKSSLTEMDRHSRRGNAPREVNAEKPVDDAHKVDLAPG
jgi:hypothetical protein